MISIKYQIEFFSDWQAGSGLTIAGDVDAAVLKEDGLPYIPGKTLKGLILHAAKTILEFQGAQISKEFIDEVFGEPRVGKEDENAATNGYNDKEGQCFFSSAYLNENLQLDLDVEEKSLLYRKLASTKINENGVAENQSLRKIEVAIPLVLEAYIGDVKEEWIPKFEQIFKMIKRLGGSRHRGLGRCQFSIIK